MTHCRQVILELGESFDAVEHQEITRSFDLQTARLYQEVPESIIEMVLRLMSPIGLATGQRG